MSADDLDELMSLEAFDLTCIEQPLSTSDLTATAALAEVLRTPICLDETITSLRSARDAIRYGACSVFCLKPSRLGGVRATLGILEMARAANMGVFMGGMFETGLGRAALGALAGHPGATLISDVAAPITYLESDPCSLKPPADSLQGLHREPGIGPWPDRSELTLEASATQ
jgi:O-succinylbenzoate synthase